LSSGCADVWLDDMHHAGSRGALTACSPQNPPFDLRV
jgi:hypothetical protein